MKAIAPLGLNAVGKPFSEPSYAHLRQPYGFSMRFVGDPPPKADNGRRYRRRQPPPAPLLDESSALQKQLLDAHDRLYRTQRRIALEIDRARSTKLSIGSCTTRTSGRMAIAKKTKTSGRSPAIAAKQTKLRTGAKAITRGDDYS